MLVHSMHIFIAQIAREVVLCICIDYVPCLLVSCWSLARPWRLVEERRM